MILSMLRNSNSKFRRFYVDLDAQIVFQEKDKSLISFPVVMNNRGGKVRHISLVSNEAFDWMINADDVTSRT